ncbi:MAG: CHAD domain-containing protein [Bryobacteraceae bacterium]
MKNRALVNFAERSTQAALLRVAKELRRAARDPEDVDIIHDLRVSIRRYTQCLGTFAALFDPEATKRIRRRLRKLMSLCGETRNCDVAIQLLQSVKVPLGDPAYSALRERRDLAAKELTRHLAKKRWADFAAKHNLRCRNKDHGSEPWDNTLGVFANARQVLPQMADDFFAAGASAAATNRDYEMLHAFRLRAKRFRYTLELFRSVYGRSMDQRLTQMRGLQDRLGGINDCLTTLELVASTAKTKRRIEALLASRDRDFREHWNDHFSSRAGVQWRSWLSSAKQTKALPS